jgi:hypothetical protein
MKQASIARPISKNLRLGNLFWLLIQGRIIQMPPESWLVLTVAAAFLLLGVAGSPLAWAIAYHRRSRFEELMEQRWRKVTDELQALEHRLTRFDSINPAHLKSPHLERTDSGSKRGGMNSADSFTRVDQGLTNPRGRAVADDRGSARIDLVREPTLIAVPTLEGAPNDRDLTASGLKERHAAIWTIAETGATAEVIARATGQPVGQIELILGLRRQIDGTKSSFSHGPRA